VVQTGIGLTAVSRTVQGAKRGAELRRAFPLWPELEYEGLEFAELFFRARIRRFGSFPDVSFF
jgi:hypothetical protein